MFSLQHRPVYYFAGRERGPHEVLSEASRTVVRGAAIQVLTNAFNGSSGTQVLAKAIMGGDHEIVFDLILELTDLRTDEPGSLDKWRPLARVMLELAHVNPVVGVPLRLPFVVQGDSFERTLAAELFDVRGCELRSSSSALRAS